MSILDRSFRSASLSSCEEAAEESGDESLHRVCSRDTLDASGDIIDENPVCYSTDNLLASSFHRPTEQQSDVEDEDRSSCERMMSYEVNPVSDSEDDDDVYVPDWKLYETFEEGVVVDQQNDGLPMDGDLALSDNDNSGARYVALKMQAAVKYCHGGTNVDGEGDWDGACRLRGRKRHSRFGDLSSDLEDLVQQLEVIPAKIRRMDSNMSEQDL